MAKADLKIAVAAILPIIADRLKRAHSVAAAANICADAGDLDGAFRILFDVEDLIFQAKKLFETSSILKHEMDH